MKEFDLRNRVKFCLATTRLTVVTSRNMLLRSMVTVFSVFLTTNSVLKRRGVKIVGKYYRKRNLMWFKSDPLDRLPCRRTSVYSRAVGHASLFTSMKLFFLQSNSQIKLLQTI